MEKRMSGFTKLDSEILTSTIWAEDLPTKVVWITILAMMDKRFEVHGSIPGLARTAGVEVEDCRTAIQKFLEPDKDSRSQEFGGRRLREIDGGWFVLHGEKYRKKYSLEWRREQDAFRARERRARQNSCDTPANTDGHDSSCDVVPNRDASLSIVKRHPMEVARERNASAKLEGTGEALLTLACVGQGPHEFQVRESLVADWTGAYPGVDVLGELRRAVQWCADNPTKRKTYRGARKFLGSWLARAQESRASKGNGHAIPVPAPSSGCPEWDEVLGAYHAISPETEEQLRAAVTTSVAGGVLRLQAVDEFRAAYVERHIEDIRARCSLPVLVETTGTGPQDGLPF